MAQPDWLPEMIDVNGTWDVVLECLHDVYQEDIRKAKLRLNELPIFCTTRLEHFSGADYEQTFLHLITRDDYSTGEKQRLVDFRRAERLCWFGPIVDHADEESHIMQWEYLEGKGDVRTYLWLKDYDYVLILREREVQYYGNPFDVYFVVTSFYVDGEYNKEKMQKKYEKRLR